MNYKTLNFMQKTEKHKENFSFTKCQSNVIFNTRKKKKYYFEYYMNINLEILQEHFTIKMYTFILKNKLILINRLA